MKSKRELALEGLLIDMQRYVVENNALNDEGRFLRIMGILIAFSGGLAIGALLF